MVYVLAVEFSAGGTNHVFIERLMPGSLLLLCLQTQHGSRFGNHSPGFVMGWILRPHIYWASFSVSSMSPPFQILLEKVRRSGSRVLDRQPAALRPSPHNCMSSLALCQSCVGSILFVAAGNFLCFIKDRQRAACPLYQ